MSWFLNQHIGKAAFGSLLKNALVKAGVDLKGQRITSNSAWNFLKGKKIKNAKKEVKMEEETKLCPECGVEFKSTKPFQASKRLRHHLERVHTPDNMKKHQCQDCGKGFHVPSRLEMHRLNNH